MIEFNATFLVAMLSFVVFIFIMNAIFYNPILNIIRKREEYINSNYNEAKANADKATELNSVCNDKLQDTKIQCRLKIKDIVEAAQNDSNKKTHSAREYSKSKIQSEKELLLQKEENLKDTVKATVVKDLASSITAKLLGNSTKPVNDVNYDIVNKVMD